MPPGKIAANNHANGGNGKRETDVSRPQDEGPALQIPTKCFSSRRLPKGGKKKQSRELARLLAHACNPRVLDAEVRGLQVQGQPVLQSEILSQKAKANKPASAIVTREGCERMFCLFCCFSKGCFDCFLLEPFTRAQVHGAQGYQPLVAFPMGTLHQQQQMQPQQQ